MRTDKNLDVCFSQGHQWWETLTWIPRAYLMYLWIMWRREHIDFKLLTVTQTTAMKQESKAQSCAILHFSFLESFSNNVPIIKNRSKYDEVAILYSHVMRSRLNTNIFLCSISLNVFSSMLSSSQVALFFPS